MKEGRNADRNRGTRRLGSPCPCLFLCESCSSAFVRRWPPVPSHPTMWQTPARRLVPRDSSVPGIRQKGDEQRTGSLPAPALPTCSHVMLIPAVHRPTLFSPITSVSSSAK